MWSNFNIISLFHTSTISLNFNLKQVANNCSLRNVILKSNIFTLFCNKRLPLRLIHLGKFWTHPENFVYLVHKRIFPKINISYPLIRTRTCAYQGVKNFSFLEKCAYVLNKWFPFLAIVKGCNFLSELKCFHVTIFEKSFIIDVWCSTKHDITLIIWSTLFRYKTNSNKIRSKNKF